MGSEMAAEEFCRFMWEKYLVERQYDIFGEIVDERISVIGTGAHEVSRNIEEFASSMAKESGEWDGKFVIKSQWYQSTQLSDTLYLVIGEIVAKEDSEDGILFDVHFRFSVILKKNSDGWRVVHVHQSVPDPNQASDEFFPHRMLEKNSQQVIYNLRHDNMTGVLNRAYLKEIVDRTLAADPEGVMLMMDVDKFKNLNDTYGHPFGDKVLILLARSLRISFGQENIGRVGGDEFVVFIPRKDIHSAEKLLRDFKADWEESQKCLQLPYRITVSIGAAVCPRDGRNYDDVWRSADEALYMAKNSGNDQLYYRK